MADDKLERFLRSTPKVFNAQSNPVINALLQGFAGSDDTISAQIQNTKAQLFVRTASGTNLDNLANSLGVSRPTALGLTDTQFQELIPNLSLKAKQLRKTLYDTAEIFWGPEFIFTNVQTANHAPFNIHAGDSMTVQIDQKIQQVVKVLINDIATPGAATAQELVTILARIKGANSKIVVDSLTGNQFVNLAVKTPGPVGILNILGGTLVGPTKVDFPIGKHRLTEQAQRFAIYEMQSNEVIIEIPAIVPALRRTLKGSHHFHIDSTLAAPVAPGNGIWQGSFLFDPGGVQQTFTVSQQAATTQEALNKGDVYVKVTVDNTVKFIETSGYLIFGWGTDHQEEPVKFRGVPNSNTVLLDPSYVFKNNQPSGTTINVLADQKPYIPRLDGSDLAIYLTSPSGARNIVESILASLVAAGVVVTFVVLAPSFEYLITNPYLE